MATYFSRINDLQMGLQGLMDRGHKSRGHWGRRMVGACAEALGAKGGAMAIWPYAGQATVSTKGLGGDLGRKLRTGCQAPPAELDLVLQRVGASLVGKGGSPPATWPSLDKALEAMAGESALALVTMQWVQCRGMLILEFARKPTWPDGFGEACGGVVGLAACQIMLAREARTRLEDYQRIFANSRDMVYLSSRDGSWVDVNPAGVKMLGYRSREELLSRRDSATKAYQDPADRQAFMAAIEKDGFVRDYEVGFQRKDGTPIEVSITASVREVDGHVVGYEGIIKDITARKRAEELATRERAIIDAIIDVAPVAIFAVDQNHQVIHWNRSCENLTGVAREDILGTDKVWQVFGRPPGVSLADVLVNQDQAKLAEIYGHLGLRESSLASGAWEAQAHFELLGGKEREAVFSAAPLISSGGELEGAVEAILDLTEMRRLERKAAEQERLYRAIFEANREGIALHDGERFVLANEAFRDMFGLEQAGWRERDFLELVAPEYRRDYLEWLRDLDWAEMLPVFAGLGLRGEETFFLEMVAAPVPFSGKTRTLYTVRDVSDRRAMEEQLVRNERLAATGKLAFDIAHEISNPLGGIITFSHLLVEDMEDAATRERVEKVIKLANRCSIIVRGLLDFAREDAPEMAPVALPGVLRDMLGLLDGHVIIKDLQIAVDAEEGLPLVLGHRNKLEQVFLNLVVNAAEAMEGKGRLDITLRRDLARREVRAEFIDNGPGMTEEVKRRIFDPFYTTKDRGRGTGLGLAISHGIIKQHHGHMEVESTPGQGTRITVVLPAR